MNVVHPAADFPATPSFRNQPALAVGGVIALLTVAAILLYPSARIVSVPLLALVVVALILWNPFIGLCLTFVSIAFVKLFPAVPFASSLTAVLGGLTLASTLARLLARRWRLFLPRDRAYVWALAFGAAVVASLVLSAKLSLQAILTYVELVMLVWLVGQLAGTRRHIEVLMAAWVLALAVTQIAGLANFDFSVLGRENRLITPTGNPNEMAYYSVTGICFIIYFLLNARRLFGRLLLVAAFALGTASVLLSASRAGLVILVAVVLHALFSLRSRLVRGLRLSGILVLAVAALLLTTSLNLSYIPELAAGLRQTAASVAAGEGSEARYVIARNGLRTWSKHPVFGVGLGLGPTVGAYVGGRIKGAASHSTYLTALVETGLVGFILFCGLLIVTWLNLSHGPPKKQVSGRRRVESGWAWRAVFISFLLMSLAGCLLLDKVLWVTIGVGVLLRARHSIWADPESAGG